MMSGGQLGLYGVWNLFKYLQIILDIICRGFIVLNTQKFLI